MSNGLQTNLGCAMLINYDSFLLCVLVDIIFRNARGRERIGANFKQNFLCRVVKLEDIFFCNP